ncbi:hypothetical protein AMJ57_04005 [Parcubacteria bacterium SG8_24]|nr:MAG: hypothetical protein AMJ57_04005 [Parcubacteria bacterium SG8_24]
MPYAESTLLILLPILFFGLVAPELFRRLKLPYVTSLILVGAIVGPYGLDYVRSNEVVEFFGFLGFTFLMLLAGLETDVGTLQHSKRKIATLALANGGIPFLAGALLSLAFGFGLLPSLVVGTVFISSSVAIVIPTIRSFILKEEDGQIMIAAVVVEDIVSLFLLAIVFQSISPITDLPLPQYFVALIISFLFIRRVVPRLARRFFSSSASAGQTRYESQLRFVIVLTIAVLIFFSFLGVHPIVAAFLVGLLLADVVTSGEIIGKLHTLGYGLFVPVFFFIVGMEMDLGILLTPDLTSVFVGALILSFFVAKAGGGYIGARLAGLESRYASFFGIVSLPQLTTTLAAVYAASTVGIIGPRVVTAITLLSVVTTVLTPLLLRVVTGRFHFRPQP